MSDDGIFLYTSSASSTCISSAAADDDVCVSGYEQFKSFFYKCFCTCMCGRQAGNNIYIEIDQKCLSRIDREREIDRDYDRV